MFLRKIQVEKRSGGHRRCSKEEIWASINIYFASFPLKLISGSNFRSPTSKNKKQANFFGKNIVKKLKDKIRYIFHIIEIFLILYFEKDDRI